MADIRILVLIFDVVQSYLDDVILYYVQYLENILYRFFLVKRDFLIEKEVLGGKEVSYRKWIQEVSLWGKIARLWTRAAGRDPVHDHEPWPVMSPL